MSHVTRLYHPILFIVSAEGQKLTLAEPVLAVVTLKDNLCPTIYVVKAGIRVTTYVSSHPVSVQYVVGKNQEANLPEASNIGTLFSSAAHAEVFFKFSVATTTGPAVEAA